MTCLESSTESTDPINSKFYLCLKEKCYKIKHENRKHIEKIIYEKILQSQLDEIEKEKKAKLDESLLIIESDETLNLEERRGDKLLEDLLKNRSLEYFSDTIDKNRSNLNDLHGAIFRKLVITIIKYNNEIGCYNSRKNNDEMGKNIVRVSHLIGYFLNEGKVEFDRLIPELKTPENQKHFNYLAKIWYKDYKRDISKRYKRIREKNKQL
ncbi:uncharacterized protein VNE69_12089 [Vairimorpha necatrix]|uniref:Uncharacterized protein n=1 Tax=Vairimorpha necatrix TaxID=6039 RepID=A0AAX4JGL3_9MICR